MPPSAASAPRRRRRSAIDWRTFAWVETTAKDLSYALRAIRRNPGFTAVAVLSLALGIGANTAIFSLIDALMLRSLPVHDPQQIVQLVVPQPAAPPFEQFTYPMVQTLASHKEIFSGLYGISPTVFNDAEAERIRACGSQVTIMKRSAWNQSRAAC